MFSNFSYTHSLLLSLSLTFSFSLPLSVIEGHEMPGSIRSLCAVEIDGIVWVGCESGKIVRFAGESGDVVDVLNAHTDCIMTIASGKKGRERERENGEDKVEM